MKFVLLLILYNIILLNKGLLTWISLFLSVSWCSQMKYSWLGTCLSLLFGCLHGKVYIVQYKPEFCFTANWCLCCVGICDSCVQKVICHFSYENKLILLWWPILRIQFLPLWMCSSPDMPDVSFLLTFPLSTENEVWVIIHPVPVSHSTPLNYFWHMWNTFHWIPTLESPLPDRFISECYQTHRLLCITIMACAILNMMTRPTRPTHFISVAHIFKSLVQPHQSHAQEKEVCPGKRGRQQDWFSALHVEGGNWVCTRCGWVVHAERNSEA